MVGMIGPGVMLAGRRRIHSHQYDYDRYSSCDPFLPHRIRPYYTATTTAAATTTMGATALQARTRLEEKLSSFRSRNKHPHPQTQPQPQPLPLPLPPPVQVRSSTNVLQGKQIQKSKMETRRRESTEICRNQWNSEREICAVCLEDLQGLREVTDLPCSHRYHSHCLIPWLASHSHCPCCRSLVPSKQ